MGRVLGKPVIIIDDVTQNFSFANLPRVGDRLSRYRRLLIKTLKGRELGKVSRYMRQIQVRMRFLQGTS